MERDKGEIHIKEPKRHKVGETKVRYRVEKQSEEIDKVLPRDKRIKIVRLLRTEGGKFPETLYRQTLYNIAKYLNFLAGKQRV